MLNINTENFSNTLSPNYELSDLVNFIKERFRACGIEEIKENTELNLIGGEIKLSDNEKGTIKFILKIVLNRIDAYLYAAENYDFENWTEITRSSGVSYAVTLNNANPLTIYSIPKDNQIFGLTFVESGNVFRGILGIAYPTADQWYDENQGMLAGLLHPTVPNNFVIPRPNPANNNIACRFKIEAFATRNPHNLAQILTAPYCTFHNFGIGAKFNENVGISNNQGFSIADISTDGSNKYWNLYCGDNGVVLKCS